MNTPKFIPPPYPTMRNAYENIGQQPGREMRVPMTAVPIGERLWVVPVEVATYIQELEAQLAALK